jgi:hypothetical protein
MTFLTHHKGILANRKNAYNAARTNDVLALPVVETDCSIASHAM